MKIEFFHNLLLSKGLVTYNHIAYYTRWVEAFLQFCHLGESELFSDRQVDEFIDSMANRWPLWQLDQAREAITLFRFCQTNKKKYTWRLTAFLGGRMGRDGRKNEAPGAAQAAFLQHGRNLYVLA